jgi:C4-dicarboxylate transporter DctM subunit
MDYTTAALICLAVMLFLLLLGMPIAWALGFSSVTIGLIAFGAPALQKIGWTTFHLLYNLLWTPLPLFTLMACIISETSIGADLYRAARNWLSRIPGGLIVASIMGEAGMAAALGASAPTILAVGKVAVPEFERYHYDRGLSVGALLCGGVLGPLIPPSTTMIIYSVLTNVPLGRLFIAGIVPGILLALMLAMTAIVLCIRNPALTGTKVETVNWRERFSSLKKVWPVVLVGCSVLGSIYLGVATPTEAGGFGCFIVLIVAVALFKFRLKGLYRAMVDAALLNAMLLLIFVAAVFFTYVVGSSNIAESLATSIKSLNIPPILVIVSIQIALLILGCFIDGITIMLLTIPLFAPIAQALGFDLLWFGVLYVTNMEIGLITPPMGINLFLVRNAFNVPTSELIRGTAPFLAVLIFFLAVTVAFPQLSIWLPGLMRGR